MMQFSEKTFKVVKYQELDRLITEYFREVHGFTSEYQCCESGQYNNDTYNLVSIEEVDEKYLSNLPEDVLDCIKYKDFRYPLGPEYEGLTYYVSDQQIMDYLYRVGHIPPGEYLIHVSW